MNLTVDRIDVVTVLLCGDTENVYMWQPEGFIEKGKEDFICLLHKVLYGLKQASGWSDKISKVVLSLGFKRLLNGPCAFLQILVITLCVGDALIFANNDSEIEC